MNVVEHTRLELIYIMCKIVKGNKYYWNNKSYSWQGLKDNATPLTSSECDALKARFPVDTYFIKWKDES